MLTTEYVTGEYPSLFKIFGFTPTFNNLSNIISLLYLHERE